MGAVQAKEVYVQREKAFSQVFLCQQNGSLSIGKEKGKPFVWVVRVKGNISSPRLEDSQQAHNHLQRAFNTEPNWNFRPHSQLA